MDYTHPGKLPWQWKTQPFEDVSPINNCDVPLACFSFREGTVMVFVISRPFFPVLFLHFLPSSWEWKNAKRALVKPLPWLVEDDYLLGTCRPLKKMKVFNMALFSLPLTHSVLLRGFSANTRFIPMYTPEVWHGPGPTHDVALILKDLATYIRTQRWIWGCFRKIWWHVTTLQAFWFLYIRNFPASAYPWNIAQDPQPTVYEGIPFICGFGDAWHMLGLSLNQTSLKFTIWSDWGMSMILGKRIVIVTRISVGWIVTNDRYYLLTYLLTY